MVRLLDCVTPHYRTYFQVAFLGGMHPNEQIAPKWGRVDFVHRTIAVREGRAGKVEGMLKTGGGARDMDRLEPLCEAPRQHLATTWLRGACVFLNQEARPVDITALRRRTWYPALKRGGIRRRTTYQTRQMFATLMPATGEPPEWIAKQLGHTSTRTLFQRYAKFIPNVTHQDGTAKAYRGWFKKGGETRTGALHLPWRVTLCAVVPSGWPLGRYGPTTRRPVGAVVHPDRYGHQPFKTFQP